jgi:hypothetical protein
MSITAWRVQLLSSEINHTKFKKKERDRDIWKYENELDGEHLDGSRDIRLRCCEMDETGSEMCAIMGFGINSFESAAATKC